MISEAHFTAGLVAGFLGSAHCVGMCGPLVAALSLAGDERRSMGFHLMYNLGRTLTYTAMGAVCGLLGSVVFLYTNLAMITGSLLVMTDLLVIVAGLSVLGVLGRLNLFNLSGKGVSRPFVAAAAKIAKYRSPLVGLPVGMLFGFIPCGFSYAMLLVSAVSEEPSRGALTMLGFGLGTAPALVLSGGFAHLVRGWRGSVMLKGLGLLIVGIGAYHLYRHVWIMYTSMVGTCCG